ncbi:MAG: hypothetical protein Q4B73_10250 [Lachnospiraceae bacterium]|nr:hypothetical protein [Lachnospiraceae bacterium]
MWHKYLHKRLEELNVMRRNASASLKNAPEGSLVCQMHKGKRCQFLYHKADMPGDRHRRYLSVKEAALIKKLAQKEYDLDLLGKIDGQINALKELETQLDRHELGTAFSELHPKKQLLVTPYRPSDEDYLAMWLHEHPGGQNSYAVENGFMTEQKEEVRSKSEKMIADKLFYSNVTYRYETSLNLGGKIIYPDFTILNMRTRETLYLEHFGKMDDPAYCTQALKRIDLYSEYGILQGQQLFFTMETGDKPVNMKVLDDFIKTKFT